MTRGALALAAAAAALGCAQALSSMPAAGVPCASVSPASAASSTSYCDATITPFDYYGAMKAGTINNAALGVESNGGCDFIEDAFEETFSSSVLNFTRWLPDELDGQEHCVGLPPAGNTTCTMMMSQQVQLAQQMPVQLGGGTGAILKLSQGPCNNPANPTACCNSKGNCAKWAGAHLVSAGCIQYGVLELEAAFDMPANAGGFYFTATYIVYGSKDPSWNELDIGMINNVLGQLEFHATIFTADKDTPTATAMDALNFAQVPIGTSINVNTTIKAINGVAAPQRYYNSSFASAFHTYKLVWTPTTVAWMVDTVVYRNLSYAPWRPMSIRQILRTNKGVNAVGPQFGDSTVYIRRIRYTPYSAQAVADAYRCTSMFACYGAMPAAPLGLATAYVSLNSVAPPGTGRRSLLQSAAANSAVLEGAVASLVPGMPAENVTATPTAFGLSFRLTINMLDPGNQFPTLDALGVYNSFGLQSPLVSGLADDVIPAPQDVLVQSVTEDAAGQMVYVQVLVTNYPTAADMLTDYNTFTTSGAAQLDSTAASLNNVLGLSGSNYISTGDSTSSTDPDYAPAPVQQNATSQQILSNPLLCPSYPASFDNTCTDANNDLPSVWCPNCVLLDLDQINMVTTYAVSVPVAASAVDSIEAALSSAVSTGAMGAAISSGARRRSLLQSGGGSVNLTTTNNLLMQRILTSNSAADTAALAAVCGDVANKEAQWRGAGIAFIIGFGVLLVILIAVLSFRAGRKAERSAATAAPAPEMTKMVTDFHA